MLAIQEAAYSHGSYGAALDNYSGPNTINGVKGLQAYFGLSQDGCAGPATWGRVRQTFGTSVRHLATCQTAQTT